MPTSNLALALTILDLVNRVPHASVLDVGPGHGKYAILVREYLAGVGRLEAVEAWDPYVDDFRLECLYDRVHRADVRDLSSELLGEFDVVLMIDVLEHLEHADGEELLRRIAGRVVICTPETYFQNPEHEEVPPESHRSLWTLRELESVRSLEVGKIEIGGVIARTAPLG